LADAKLAVLEEENAALRKELYRRVLCAPRECLRCGATTFETGCPPKDGDGESPRLSALERKIEELRPSIMRDIEERLRGRRRSRPEAGPRKEPTTAGSTSRLPSLLREQEGNEWKVVKPKERRKGQRKGKKATEKESRKNAKSSTGPLTAAGEEDEMLAETKCCEVN
jgi:hypothetical protein